MKGLNTRPGSLNLIGEKTAFIELIGTGEDFRNRTPITQALKPTVNRWDLMKLKSFCTTKDTIVHSHRREKTFTNYSSDKRSTLTLQDQSASEQPPVEGGD